MIRHIIQLIIFINKDVNGNRGPVAVFEVAEVNASRVSELATLCRMIHIYNGLINL